MSTVKRTPITTVDPQQDDFLHELAAKVNKTLERDAVMVGDEYGDSGIPYWLLTGIPSLDFAVGGINHPGVPGARIIETYGAEASGKSTLSLWLMRQGINNLNAIAYHQDAERVLTPEIIEGTGINMRRVMRDQPDILEDAFDAQQAVLDEIRGRQGAVITVLDSVAACSTKAEIDGDMTDQQMATHARVMSKGFRKLKAAILDSWAMSIWVNQIRDKVGVTYGEQTSTFGGRALKFYASVRIKLAKIKTLKRGDNDPYGATIQATITKNKVAPPLRKAEYDILFMQTQHGSYPKIDINGALLDWCKNNDMIGGSTGRYEVNGKAMYKAAAVDYLDANPDVYNQLIDLAYSNVNPDFIPTVRQQLYR